METLGTRDRTRQRRPQARSPASGDVEPGPGRRTPRGLLKGLLRGVTRLPGSTRGSQANRKAQD
jgi:hypothetical protein